MGRSYCVFSNLSAQCPDRMNILFTEALFTINVQTICRYARSPVAIQSVMCLSLSSIDQASWLRVKYKSSKLRKKSSWVAGDIVRLVDDSRKIRRCLCWKRRVSHPMLVLCDWAQCCFVHPFYHCGDLKQYWRKPSLPLECPRQLSCW